MVALVDRPPHTYSHPPGLPLHPVAMAYKATLANSKRYEYPPQLEHGTMSRFLAIPSSSVMSSQTIRSFQNRLLFSVPACGNGFFHTKRSLPLDIQWRSPILPILTNLGSQERSLKKKTVTRHLNKKKIVANTSEHESIDMKQHQRGINTHSYQEFDSVSVMNPITESEVTQPKMAQEILDPEPNNECFQEQYEVSDYVLSECAQEDDDLSHSGYESDDDEEDGCVVFSDESLDPTTDRRHDYMKLVSSESGYFECLNSCALSDSAATLLHDGWSDGDSDSGSEIEFCSDVWDCFETQALTPMITYKKTKTQSTSDTHSPQDENCWVYQNNESTQACPNMVTDHGKIEPEDKRTTRTTGDKSKKHVSFKPDDELVEVHTIIAWQYAYRAARKGPWEQFARDRCHFRRRIDSVSAVLEPCLSAKLSRMCSVNCMSDS